MVDIIQESDRYTVFKDSIITGALPIQGRDVKVTVKNDRVLIDYKNSDKSEVVRRNLDEALKDWKI